MNVSTAVFPRLAAPAAAAALLFALAAPRPAWSAPPEDAALLLQAPTEIDFVRTALENTMAISYQRIRDTWKQRSLPDLRTATYATAIETVANAYQLDGIFP